MLSDLRSAHTKKWAEVLASEGMDVHIFGLTCATERFSGVTIHEGRISQKIANKGDGALIKLIYMKEIIRLKKLIKRLKPDVIHAHYASSYGLLGALTGFKPFLVSVWGMEVRSFPEKSVLHRSVIQFVLRKADVLFSTSEYMARGSKNWTDKEFVLTPFGVYLDDDASPKAGKAEDYNAADDIAPKNERDKKITIGCVKTIAEMYGQHVLIRALSEVIKEAPGYDIKLELVGRGPGMDDFKELAEKLGIGDKVIFRGYVPNEQIMAVHDGFDIEVYPTQVNESFGVSTVEGMSRGVPCIVSKRGGLQDIVEDGVSGLHFKHDDVSDLKNAILKLILDKDLRLKIGAAGKQRVRDRYDLKENARVMIREYERLLAQKK
jgi:Glycosyltransferase